MSPVARALLHSAGAVTLADLRYTADLLEAVRETNVLWVRLRHFIDHIVLDAAPNLRIVATPTTGLSHIDLGAAARRGIEVLSLQGLTQQLQNVRATAEHTIGLLLALLRHIPRAAQQAPFGNWDRDAFRGAEVFGKTAGVVGYGRLGRIVARYLVALGARVLACDRPGHVLEPDPGVQPTTLEELLPACDIVTVHVNLCPDTRRLFDRTVISAMKPGAWLINTSRGELFEEEALRDALASGHLSGAALDVLSGEQQGLASHPLALYARHHDNLLLTPHIGGCTAESMEKTEVLLAQLLLVRLHESSSAAVLDSSNTLI